MTAELRYNVERPWFADSSMLAMASSEPITKTGVVQFSLRTVFLVVTALAVFLGICAWTGWNMAFMLPLALGISGILVMVQAVRTQRRGQAVVGGFLMALALGVLSANALTVVSWGGRKGLDVEVIVLDASSLTPLPDTTIEVLDGPASPLLGGLSPNVDRDFSPAYSPQGTIELTTDEHGYAQFRHEFFAAGTDRLPTDSGYVDTTGVWLRVTATGYRTTYMPLDRQSVRPRDIHDETPICVTVPVGKE